MSALPDAALNVSQICALQRWPLRRVEASGSSRELGLDVPRLFGDLDMDIQTDMQRQLSEMQRSFQQMEQEVSACVRRCCLHCYFACAGVPSTLFGAADEQRGGPDG